MSKEYRAKVFRSGNSVALRLPKALGVAEGTEMRVREEGGRFVCEPLVSGKRIDLSGVYGSIPAMKPLSKEDREFDERDLDWGKVTTKRD